MAASMDVEGIANSLKQLVVGSGKFIQEAHTFEQAEERIRHLEENDDQFHRYDIVKFIKSEIEECIGPIVEEEIERYSESGHNYFSDTEALVTKVTERISKSQQFDELRLDITRLVQEAVDRLVENFEEEFRDLHKEESPPPTPKEKDPYQFSDDESTLSGSYNQHGFLFVTHEQLKKNIEHLDKKNNIQTRRAALNDLIHMSLNDVLTNDENYQREWASLERGIIDALFETDDETLPKSALKLISRGLSSTHGNSRELYHTLCQYLYEFFSSRKSLSTLKVKNGLDIKRLDTDNLLRAIRLLNDYQRHIPNYWVRYPTRFLSEVLEITLKLVSISADNPVYLSQSMTPIHMLAVLDPMAEWFIKWTHGYYSRLPLFESMKKHTRFLESVVRSILEFVASRKVPFDLVSEASENFSYKSSTGPHQMRYNYTGDELEYLFFVHSMNIISCLLVHKEAIKLFPVTIRGYDEEITVTHLICSITHLVTNPAGHGATTSRNITARHEPSILASDVLKKLCSSESTYKLCMCNDQVTRTLLTPVTNWLDSVGSDGSHASEASYLNIADILALMASKSEGRRHLLYGEHGDTFSRASLNMEIIESSAAHALTEFTKRALAQTLPSSQGQASKSVASAFLFVCRQFYNNGEGLQAIYSYDLHAVVTQTYKQAEKSIQNVNPHSTSRKDSDKIWWEETLRDNLLNFATTSKGVLLMHLSGAMPSCVAFLYKRHKQRKQVSRLEKFGYGSLITQIAGSPCGIMALEKHRLISLLVEDAWNSIEPGEESEVPFEPKIYSVEPINKASHKPLVALVHVLSNFTSVFELIGGERLPSSPQYTLRDKPTTLIELFNRVIIINQKTDTDKIHYLFNFEQSHTFGLRLLNSLIACLDTLLLVQSQFKVFDALIESQTAEDCNQGGAVVVDQLSMERNHVLARGLMIGGPTERVLPPQSLPNNRHTRLSYPLIHGSPLPKEYLPNIAGKSSMKQVHGRNADNELSRFLNDSKQSQQSKTWLDSCRVHLRSMIAHKADLLKGNLLLDVLERSVGALSAIPEEALFTAPGGDLGLKNFKLTTLQELGVKNAIQYGVHLKLITSTAEAQDNLTKLLRQTGAFFKQQQRQVGSSMRSLNHNYIGFDWFVATMFLMMRANREKTWRFLSQASALTSSAYMWPARMHRSIHLPPAHVDSGIMPVLYSTCHNVELILQVELPLVYSAFRMSGFTASQICQLWIRQCFWNFLDWQDISLYITICFSLGIDYQVYLCVAILRHLQKEILNHQQQQQLGIFLRETPITGFKVNTQLDYMQQLEKRFRRTILSDLMNLSKP